MKSRMDKYYKDEEVMQRTSKNDFLYDELYREKRIPKSNITVIDNINEIDITKIKSMVDNRENYKRVREYKSIVNPNSTYRDSEIDYNFDEIDNSNYDINEILKNKRSDRVYSNDPSKVRSITSKEYDILSSLEIKDEDIKMSDDLINHEKQLVDLFNTVSRTAVNEQTDLFSNLKEDTDDKKKDEETFYTSTSKFDSNDFSEEFKEKNGSKIFVVIAILACLIAIGVIIYIKFFN